MNYPSNNTLADLILISHFTFQMTQEMQKTFARYKTMMLSLNLGARELQQGASEGAQELQEGLHSMNCRWTEACAGLEGWEGNLRNTLMRCQVTKLYFM